MREDILDKLKDLLLQATTERSHFYVAGSCKAAIAEIERLRLEIEELRAAFSAASRGMSHKEVFDLITAAKKYVHDRHEAGV